jgi:uncharacterized membrane protein YesL
VFSLDGILNRICNKIYYLSYLNIIFLLFCLPLITIPAATAALFGVSRKLVEGDEQSIFTSYRQLFMDNLKRSLVLGVFIAVIGLCLLLNFRLLFQTKTHINPLFFTGLCFSGIIYIITALYLFPLMVNGYLKLKQLIINSFIIGFYKFHITLLNLIILMGLLFISLRFSFLFIVLFFSVSAYITSWFFNKKVAKILKILNEQAIDKDGKENHIIVLEKNEILR